jgi:hypothetical protein
MVIVIARYNEPLEWIDSLDSRWKSMIYNKGDSIQRECVVMDNNGREASSYLRYIVDHYSSLPEYVCFVQGDPFCHSPNLYEELSSFISCEGFKFFDVNGHESCGGNSFTSCDKGGSPHHGGLNIQGFCSTHNIILPDGNLDFSPGAQFIVNRDIILKRDFSFYSKLYSAVHVGGEKPDEAYVMERIWKYIFS